MGNRYKAQYKQSIIDGLANGKTPKEISKEIGCAVNTVYNMASRYHISYTKTALGPKPSALTKEMRAYKAMGHSYREVAERFGVTRDQAHNACKNIAPQAGNRYLNERDREIALCKYLNERNENYEYVSGDCREYGYVYLKCKKCGYILKRSYSAARAGKIRCENCAAIESIKKQREKTIARKKAKDAREKSACQKREVRDIESRKKKEERKHECAVCGKLTMRPRYCSGECSRKASNKQHEINRRLKIQGALIDKDITLQGLYRRDGGRCYICGLYCLYDDYTTVNGVTICGDWYPSIDHVVPLAKGGNHSWKNIRLAHRKCNTAKGINDTRRVENEY